MLLTQQLTPVLLQVDMSMFLIGRKLPTLCVCVPVLGEHRQPLQQDRDHRLVQVRPGRQRLQVHFLLRHLLCARLLVLHSPLRSSRKACWEFAAGFTSSTGLCVSVRVLPGCCLSGHTLRVGFQKPVGGF